MNDPSQLRRWDHRALEPRSQASPYESYLGANAGSAWPCVASENPPPGPRPALIEHLNLEHYSDEQTRWWVIIHLTFVLWGIGVALMGWVEEKAHAVNADHDANEAMARARSAARAIASTTTS
jgi:hypothetical protein